MTDKAVTETENHLLGLQLVTDPRWASLAGKSLEDILVDHAWCEQKAASSGISLIILFPDKPRLVEVMTAVVAEEWQHFTQVMEEMKRRNIPFQSARKDEYVMRLLTLERKGGSKVQQLMEKLLIAALIEARSCERFKMLWKSVPDPELAAFYHRLMISEAGHYRVFLELAEEYAGKELTRTRWKELLQQEATIMASIEFRADRMH